MPEANSSDDPTTKKLDGPIKPPIAPDEPTGNQQTIDPSNCGPTFDTNPQVAAATVLPPGTQPSEDTKTQLQKLQAEQKRQLLESDNNCVQEIAEHLREARLLASHLPPHRELSLVATAIENAFLALQSFWTTRSSGKDFLYRCADHRIPTSWLLTGSPPLYHEIRASRYDAPSQVPEDGQGSE